MNSHSRWFRLILGLTLALSFISLPPYSLTNPNGKNIAQAANGPADYSQYLPIVAMNLPTVGWPTVGADPQRTSWTTSEVTGNLHVEWYLPVEAYIPQNVQLIAANGLIYVATARGLYALNAANGSITWRFDTDMPLGNSPTVVGKVVYFAGYDRKVHAVDALTGAQIWEFNGAAAGYDTNPLVVEGKVILGNRDGNLYALNAHSGQLLWTYPTNGPISLTAAYKDGVVYFASNDHYAYAVTTDGVLKWKSQKLPGDGIQSYWPVIFSDPATGKDLVIYPLSTSYRTNLGPGTQSVNCTYGSLTTVAPCDTTSFYNDDLFYNLSTDPNTQLGTPVSINEPWVLGRSVLNYSRVSEYFENDPNLAAHVHKPWLRLYVILNTDDGSEYTYDSDQDGYGEYAPIVPFAAESGNAYPPVLGADRLLYFSNLWLRNGQGRVMGWRVGTPYLVQGAGQGASSEPQALSAGGNTIYRSICCDRVGDWFNTYNPYNWGWAWHYISTLDDQAPGYDQMWYFLSNDLDRLYGNYGNVNGIYHNHGDQNPIIPYNGRIYIHRSNAIIAYGTQQGPGKLPLLRAVATPQVMTPPTVADLTNRLDNEISKMIAVGHLRPGYFNAGQFNIYHDLNDYFNNPGDTLYVLSIAYPYLSPDLQSQLKTYLAAEFNSYFEQGMYSHIGWAQGAGRESEELPPEVTADLVNYPKQLAPGPDWSWTYPQFNFYGMWKYALIVPNNAGHIYDLAKSKLQVPLPAMPTTDWLVARPWELNGYIAGYIGFLELQKLAGRDTVDAALRTQVTNERDRLEAMRAANFTKDTYYTSTQQGYTHRTLNIARNFIMLVPELGAYLHQYALSKVQTAVSEYNYVGPYWFVSRYNGSIAESAMQNLYDYHAMFLAKAYILQESPDQLTKYLDVPAFYRGDLFYIENLVAAIQAMNPTANNPATGLQTRYDPSQTCTLKVGPLNH